MIDAIREMLGMAPLYVERPEEVSSIIKQGWTDGHARNKVDGWIR